MIFTMRSIDKIRNILNILFLIGTVATFILWISDSSLFFYAGFTSLVIKGFDFILRFVN